MNRGHIPCGTYTKDYTNNIACDLFAKGIKPYSHKIITPIFITPTNTITQEQYETIRTETLFQKARYKKAYEMNALRINLPYDKYINYDGVKYGCPEINGKLHAKCGGRVFRDGINIKCTQCNEYIIINYD